jgi:L-amino acid N-acyltransferase YncA
MTRVHIRAVQEADAAAICEIYNHYVQHTAISFEEHEVTVDEMAGRIRQIAAQFPWLVAEQDGVLLAYAYASQWKARSAYRYAVESSIYVSQAARGLGLGSVLYRQLCQELSARGAHLVIGGIALPNEHSVALHEKMGFKKVAHFEQVGYKHDRWIDVGYWQKAL